MRINPRVSNADILSGIYPESRAANAYRALVAAHGHDALCDAYGLDRDDVNGGTHWLDVVKQAVAHGDIDRETGNLT